MIAARVLIGLASAAVVLATVGSAMRTMLLPRGIPARIGRFVFVLMRWVFAARAGRNASYERRDRVMAFYAPASLLALLVTWMTLVYVSYIGLFWAVSPRPLIAAYELSGSSMFTLGFDRPGDLASLSLSFTESALGLFLLALLITYLPLLYSAFSRREAAVTALEVRAGAPPSGVTMLERFWRLQRMDRLNEVWTQWEAVFVEMEESHTSFPALNFFRSPQPDHSWVTAAGAVLDGAALYASAFDLPRVIDAEICIRAGYLALRRIADFFRLNYKTDPRPDDTTSIQREEFDVALDEMAAAGLPVKADRDAAWQAFNGWRVNYDEVLLALATLTMAPYAPWSSDRGLSSALPSLILRAPRG